MSDLLNTIALTALIGTGAALALWGIERCCAHELQMIERRARERRPEGRGGVSGDLDIHEVKNG